jgi:hypothetical protein
MRTFSQAGLEPQSSLSSPPKYLENPGFFTIIFKPETVMLDFAMGWRKFSWFTSFCYSLDSINVEARQISEKGHYEGSWASALILEYPQVY